MDLIVFSGDLAFAGSDEQAYDCVLDTLLRLLDAAGLDEKRLVTCAGNHDVEREKVGARLTELRQLRGKAATLAGMNKLADSSDYREYVSSSFDAYANLADQFGSTARVDNDALSSTYFYRELGIGVVCVNTASLSSGGLLDGTDQGQLAVAEKTLVIALERLPENLPTIVVGHHPLSWLNESSRSIMERLLSKRALAYLHGHLHEADPRSIRSGNGDVLFCQAGALFCGRQYWNGYAILSLIPDTKLARLDYRRWYEKRREFGRAEDLGEGGSYFNSDAAKAFWSATEPQIDSVAMEFWRERVLLPQIEADCRESLTGASIDDIFVPPDFARDVAYRTEGDGRVGSRVETMGYDELANSGLNLVVSSQPETGKSTLLRALALRMARTSAASTRWSIPAMVTFGGFKPYARQLEKLIRQSLPDLPRGMTVGDALERGIVTILVDDVDFAQQEKRKNLEAFVSQYPRCRYIFCSSTTFVEAAALEPEIVRDVPFTRVRMRPMRKSHLLALVENHGLRDPAKADEMVERVIRDASSLNVPLTAVTSTFLIQIIREEPDSSVINQAALIERYIEMILQKYAPRELLPGAFDFKNKVDLLCNISEIMARGDEHEPEENDLTNWCISYLKAYGLGYSAPKLVQFFLEARLFERVGTRIRFRLRMFFEFFAATRMIDDEEFRSFVFGAERYLSYANEIGFYAALARRDKSRLEEVYSAFEVLTKQLSSNEGAIPNVEAYLRDFTIPGKETTREELEKLETALRSPDIVEENRRAHLAEDLSEPNQPATLQGRLDDDSNQAITRAEFKTTEDKWVGHLLLVSGMLKHMELIPDEDKRRLLKGVLDGWVRFAVNSLAVVPQLAKERRVVFNGVTYRSALSDGVPEGEMARRLTLYMPIAVARMATVFLGTDKLRLQLVDGIGSDAEPASRQFMRAAILADLSATGFAALAETAALSLRGNRYLEHVLARKVYEVAVRSRLKRDDLAKVQSVVADLYVRLEGTPGKEQNQRRNEVISGARRQRLQLGTDKPGEGTIS